MKLKFLSLICVLLLCACAFAACTEDKDNISSLPRTESSSVASQNSLPSVEQRLVTELNESPVTQLNFYYVKGTTAAYNGYKPLADFKRYGKLNYFKQISGKDEINAFKATLKTDSWQALDMPNKSVPVMTLYFGNFIILNLEEKQGSDCYFSIYTEEDREYFLVPTEVYDSVLNLYSAE
ncbi:MAG: hypothetical protein IJ370_05410 [Oscillospiraceae bacterium]|nr:hypothetical protein [Oscillospiraceae bacterium]